MDTTESTVPLEPAPGTFPASPLLSLAIGVFYEKLPQKLLAPKKPDLGRVIQIASDDVVTDEESNEAAVLLSVLSLSCPDIFALPVEAVDDVPITFPIGGQNERKASYQPLADIAPAGVTPAQPGLSDLKTGTGEGGPGSDPVLASGEISVKLESVFANLPPEIDLFPPPQLKDPNTEIRLRIDLIRPQLKEGRVTLPASAFCAALPEDLQPLFAKIDPKTEIPIPLREIFKKLSPEMIRLREDYELDFPPETIPTPFSLQAEEDAAQRVRPGEAPITVLPDKESAKPPSDLRSAQSRLEATEGDGNSTVTQQAAKDLRFPDVFDSPALQALLMTDEALDAGKTVEKLNRLPGIRACLLTTAGGQKLAGNLPDAQEESAIASRLPLLFKQVASTMGKSSPLSGMTLHLDPGPLSIVRAEELCLLVLHEDRPFLPGVREKVLAVLRELGRIVRTPQ